MSKKPFLFCDFDGTITKNDNIVAIMKHFDPPGWKEITDKILGQKISVREGVGKLFSLLPTSRREEITAYVLNQAVIRPGFKEFVQYTRDNAIPLLIVSGGIDFFVKPLLEPYGLTDQIYCNGSDFSGEKIKITWPHPCGEACSNDCGLCKVTMLLSKKDGDHETIVIGDSITDLAASKKADYVIAREFLLNKCRELNLPHASFETFYDVIDIMERRRA